MKLLVADNYTIDGYHLNKIVKYPPKGGMILKSVNNYMVFTKTESFEFDVSPATLKSHGFYTQDCFLITKETLYRSAPGYKVKNCQKFFGLDWVLHDSVEIFTPLINQSRLSANEPATKFNKIFSID